MVYKSTNYELYERALGGFLAFSLLPDTESIHHRFDIYIGCVDLRARTYLVIIAALAFSISFNFPGWVSAAKSF